MGKQEAHLYDILTLPQGILVSILCEFPDTPEPIPDQNVSIILQSGRTSKYGEDAQPLAAISMENVGSLQIQDILTEASPPTDILRIVYGFHHMQGPKKSEMNRS